MPIHHSLLMTLLAWVLSTVLAAGGNAAETPLAVVTGNTVVQDIASRIGGARISATCLLKPGLDPHSYQPVPEDVKRLANARVVIINGLGFEGWFEGLAKEAGFKGTLVVATRGITPLKMEAEDDDHGAHPAATGADAHAHAQVDDPHAFNSIANGVRYAENIRDALIAADPAGDAGYRERTTAYIGELRKADAWAKKEFAKLPKAQRKLVTNHDALQYFAAEYGFTILAPNTALEDSEPSARDIADLVAFIRAQHVKAVFLEFGKNEKVVQQIRAEAGVALGDDLFLDGVGPLDGPAGTYLGMFQANVRAISKGLQ